MLREYVNIQELKCSQGESREGFGGLTLNEDQAARSPHCSHDWECGEGPEIGGMLGSIVGKEVRGDHCVRSKYICLSERCGLPIAAQQATLQCEEDHDILQD